MMGVQGTLATHDGYCNSTAAANGESAGLWPLTRLMTRVCLAQAQQKAYVGHAKHHQGRTSTQRPA